MRPLPGKEILVRLPKPETDNSDTHRNWLDVACGKGALAQE
jgi:ubiquinone/menaquinone biosynthesis C-methylase UbiE